MRKANKTVSVNKETIDNSLEIIGFIGKVGLFVGSIFVMKLVVTVMVNVMF